MMPLILVGDFWAPFRSIFDNIGRLIEIVVNFIVEILRLIPILFNLLSQTVVYSNYIIGFCAVLTPFILIFEIKLITGIIRSV